MSLTERKNRPTTLFLIYTLFCFSWIDFFWIWDFEGKAICIGEKMCRIDFSS